MVRSDEEILNSLSDIAESDMAERVLRDQFVTLRERDSAAALSLSSHLVA